MTYSSEVISPQVSQILHWCPEELNPRDEDDALVMEFLRTRGYVFNEGAWISSDCS